MSKKNPLSNLQISDDSRRIIFEIINEDSGTCDTSNTQENLFNKNIEKSAKKLQSSSQISCDSESQTNDHRMSSSDSQSNFQERSPLKILANNPAAIEKPKGIADSVADLIFWPSTEMERKGKRKG